ncbi:MAG TPA: ribonuclease R, partial [Halieaceae bacterium]|nr:ribonuclease R [Halieaceae bacterium]
LEIDVAIRSHGIPHEWSEAVLREAGSLEEEPREEDKKYRADLRGLGFVTIDGEDARDFDDAVYCEKRLRGWRLWVAIADVSHYVRPGSALDEEAALRGNSVYFPEQVVPMLPEALSNGLCSLKPKVDRLAMVCEMELSGSGKLTGFRFYEAVIHSQARLTYTQVGEALEGGSDPQIDKNRLKDLKRLQSLYKVLRKARDVRGAIDFETTETRILFNEQRKIDAIVPVVRNDAHKLIEECMLCANVAAARFYEEHELPVLYRVHEGPTPEKLENLRAFLGELGLDLRGGEKPTPAHYGDLLDAVQGRDDANVIQTMLLRSLRQAVYTPENEGHFGLHYPA